MLKVLTNKKPFSVIQCILSKVNLFDCNSV